MAAAIEFTYSLNKGDILKAMRKSGYYKTAGLRMIIENTILAVFLVIFGYSYFAYGDAFNLVMAIICLVFIVVILVVPSADMANRSAKMADGKELTMRVTPEKITVRNSEDEWSIALDGTSKSKLIENRIIAVMTPTKQLVVLPISFIPEQSTVYVQSMIYDGTTAY